MIRPLFLPAARGELFVKSAGGEPTPSELGHAYPLGTQFQLRAALNPFAATGS